MNCRLRLMGVLAILMLAVTTEVSAQSSALVPIPKLNIGIEQAKSPQDVSMSLQILFLLTILSLAPALLIMLTSFTRIIIILSFTRSAIGTQQVPPNSVLVGLALFLTFYTMAPVFNTVNTTAVQPYLRNQISFDQGLKLAMDPIRDFMFSQTREKDLALFIKLGGLARPKNPAEVPTHILVPAFLISELKTAFTIGFVIFVPFLVIDMIVSMTLMSMGMMMLPPVLISMPFKVLLFVLVDGWHLIAQSIALSFK